MRILVVGSGGREHAICHAFSKSEKVEKLYCAPGNAGIAQIAECVPIKADDVKGLAESARDNYIDLTFVGGETSLALGIVDEFERSGLKIIGPTRAAARLEASKAFAKDFMKRHRIPTAGFRTATSVDEAIAYISDGEFGGEGSPVVIKADGLAAGKGVIVAADREEAIEAVRSLAELVGAEAASQIVIEECLIGQEVSLLAFCDGQSFALMPPTRDHKRIGEGDTGPNTGGMGTFTNDELISETQLRKLIKSVMEPTLKGCSEEGFLFRGILFLGLMMTESGAKLLEYNVRFGDPETQSILVRLETDLVDICEAMLDGSLSDLDITWKPGSSATVVLAADGYPSKPRASDVIIGIEEAQETAGVTIFHAGTGRNEKNELITTGGRVLGVTAVAPDLNQALETAYLAVEKISWNGMQYRRDIGRTNSSA